MWRLSNVLRNSKWIFAARSPISFTRCIRKESPSSQEDVKPEVPYKTLQVRNWNSLLIGREFLKARDDHVFCSRVIPLFITGGSDALVHIADRLAQWVGMSLVSPTVISQTCWVDSQTLELHDAKLEFPFSIRVHIWFFKPTILHLGSTMRHCSVTLRNFNFYFQRRFAVLIFFVRDSTLGF